MLRPLVLAKRQTVHCAALASTGPQAEATRRPTAFRVQQARILRQRVRLLGSRARPAALGPTLHLAQATARTASPGRFLRLAPKSACRVKMASFQGCRAPRRAQSAALESIRFLSTINPLTAPPRLSEVSLGAPPAQIARLERTRKYKGRSLSKTVPAAPRDSTRTPVPTSVSAVQLDTF